MPFKQYMDLVPAECNKKTRDYIKKKLHDLDKSITDLKIKCSLCKVNHVMFKENREKLVAKLRKKFPNAMVLLKGKDLIKSPDCSYICFQQDPYFYWAFGVEKPNLWGAIDVETANSYIFYDPSQTDGNIQNPEHFLKKHKIYKALPYSEMKYEISKLGRNIFLVLSHMDQKKFNEMSHDILVSVLDDCGIWICNTVLTPIFKKCRMVKSLREQTIMAVAAKLNSEGIVFVMRQMKPGLTGYALGALFDLYIKSNARKVFKARPISCLSGEKMFCLDHRQSAIYLTDDLESGDLCILDMGIAMRNYRTNLIVTIPISGIFSEPQITIYNIVLEMRSVMLKELKPGLTFGEVAKSARKIMVKQMIQNFILEGTLSDIIESGLCDVFNPNGIGHFLGIDFYDCEEETDMHLKKYERKNIDSLVAKKGMIIALNNELYLNEAIIKKLMDTPAGVHLLSRYLPCYLGLAARVQDVVLITAYSLKLISNVPRSVEEIQREMTEKEEEIPFREQRVDPVRFNKSIRQTDVEKFAVLRRRGTTSEQIFNMSGRSFLKLRYDSTPAERRRLNLHKALKMIKEAKEWKPIKRVNQIMEEVYAYPYKIQNMLELIMIPLIPERRRPSFLPYPNVNKIAQKKFEFPKEGYGCPYFKWNQNFESCLAIQDTCLE